MSRIACVHLHQLVLESAGPGLEGGLSAIREEVRGRAVLRALSAKAWRSGLRPGMSVTEARARVPDLVVRARDEAAEQAGLARAGELLLGYGSPVEVAPPAFGFVEIGRSGRVLERLLAAPGGAPEDEVARHIAGLFRKTGHLVSVAIAADPDTARTLAAHLSAQWRSLIAEGARGRAPGIACVAAGGEDAALGALPVGALFWTDPREDPGGLVQERMHALRAALRVLGIREVAQLRQLSPAEVSSRFGETGALIMARAAGRRARPLTPFIPAERLIELQDLEGPYEDLEPLLFVLKRLFDRLEGRLEARGRTARGVQLSFEIEPSLEETIQDEQVRARSSRRRVTLELAVARPTRRAATLLALAREKLSLALPGAVRGVSVEAMAPARDRGAQLDLFSTYARKVEEVGELVGRLVAALGPDAVFSPEVRDTHRPEAAWEGRPFEIERALDDLRVGVASMKPASGGAAPESRSRVAVTLPEVRVGLAVSEMPASSPDAAADATAALALGTLRTRLLDERKKAWPKPFQRTVEDEPLPPLPPRPLELFPVPEPVKLLDERARVVREPRAIHGAAGGQAALLWRGARLPLVSISGCERLESEWWTESPLAREYVVAEVGDGRKLWLFFEPDGALFVHGTFD